LTNVLIYDILGLDFILQIGHQIMIYQTLEDMEYKFDQLGYNSYLWYELEQVKILFIPTERYFKLIGNRALSKMTLFKSETHYGFNLHIVVIDGKLYLLLLTSNDTKRVTIFKQALVEDSRKVSALERSLPRFDKWLYLKRMLQLVCAEFDFVKSRSNVQAIPDTMYQVAEMLEVLKVKL
jgi:hypothetical protein